MISLLQCSEEASLPLV